MISESFPTPDSPAAGPSRLSISSTFGDTEVDEVITDMTLTAVKECLTSSEAAAVDAAASTLPSATSPHPATDESLLMPPPDATYLQLRHHLSMCY